ncbi:TonB-dependent receptor [Sphingomonas immobilis]|uniref:TonB-dependent receptor n=1 Tax=Sphingomonas immobilis TaxID=3063997 RepID=UPI00272AE7C5|nr:TonB-dependent receptor [Sphingomonas sp. CA1-15]
MTARKRAESLQRVPVAITAASGEQLAQAGVTSLADIGRAVPGLKPQPHPSAASIVQFNLRGQGASDVLLTVDQAVGIYLDGVYVARARGLNGAFFDVERLEVLKGPQGTLYGRNTTGGAVNILTKNADFNGIHGFVGMDAGQYNLIAGRAAVNIPLINDVLAVRIAAQKTYREGFGRSAITNQDLGQDRNQFIGRASFLFTPSDKFTATLKAEYYQSRENGTLNTPIYFIPSGTLAIEAAVERGGGPFLGVASFANPTFLAAYNAAQADLARMTALGRADPYTTFTDYRQDDFNTVKTIGLTMRYELTDNFAIKSVTGYRTFFTDQHFDLDGTYYDGLEVGLGSGGIPIASGKPGGLVNNFPIANPHEQTDDFFSQELNFEITGVDDRLNLLLGGFYSNEKGRDLQVARAFPALTGIIFFNDGYEVINKSWSVFAQGDFKITDTVSITGGVRYTEEQKALVSRLANYVPATGNYICGTGVTGPGGAALVTTNTANCQSTNAREFTGVTYLASINWQVTPDILAYAKTARGFRGGAFQLRSPTIAPAGPETATDYEVGIKSDLFGRHVRFNAAAYMTKYNNKQESIIVTTPSGALATVIQNAANATLKGFEAELTVRPTTGLTIGGNLTYIEGKYDSFPGALPIQGGAAVDATGERFSLPPWSYAINARYEFPVGPGVVGIEGDWAFTAGARPPARLVNPNLPASVVDATVANVNGGSYANGRAALGLLNARINYNIKDVGLDVAFFVTNLLDKKYYYSGIDPSSSGMFVGIAGAPRMWGFTLTKKFGGE